MTKLVRVRSGIFKDGAGCDGRKMCGETVTLLGLRIWKREVDLASDEVHPWVIILKKGSTENNIGRYRSD